jgi:hypothetical protein
VLRGGGTAPDRRAALNIQPAQPVSLSVGRTAARIEGYAAPPQHHFDFAALRAATLSANGGCFRSE